MSTESTRFVRSRDRRREGRHAAGGILLGIGLMLTCIGIELLIWLPQSVGALTP
ncbi:MAG: hypothetical protein AB7T06_24665 [Kofleriaceae bacterium]